MTNNYQHRVCLDDLDFMGVVSHYQWLVLFEKSRTEVLKDPYKKLLSQQLHLVIRNIEIQYYAPAKYDELIDIQIQIIEIKSASFLVLQVARDSQHKKLAEANIILVCIDKEFKPTTIPDFFKSEIS